MPADQRNYGYADYLGDDAVHYCVRADSNWIADAGSGGAACTNAIAYGRDTSRRHKRKATFIDLTTGRSVTEPVFTPTAFAALVVGTSTLAVHVPGETATATYTLARLDPEKRPSTVLQSSRVDHAQQAYVHTVTVYLDSDVSASGSAVFAGGNQVLYVAVDITTVGSRVSLIEMDLADHYLRLGWFALGDSFDAGAGEFEHWRELQWINFLHNLWTPVPSGIGGSSPLVALASRVRWWLSPGTEAHLHVFGL